MYLRRCTSLLLSALMLTSLISTALATEELPSIPTFEVEVTEDGIYGTLSHIPEGTTDISVACAMGGLNYIVYGDGWDLTNSAEGEVALRQICLTPGQYALDAFLRKSVNSLHIYLVMLVNDEHIQTQTAILSNNLNIPPPEVDPAFTTVIEYSEYSGYMVIGNFSDIPANVAHILPIYSFDGVDYQPIESDYENDWHLDYIGTVDEWEKNMLENQLCALPQQEPLKSYLDKKLDKFYFKLQITTDDGNVYTTQPAITERAPTQPLPDELTVFATFPITMHDSTEEVAFPKHARYQVTVRENATPKYIKSLLPSTLPVKVFFMQDGDTFFTSGIIECDVQWKELPSLKLVAGEALILEDMLERVQVPVGSEIKTPHGTYALKSTLTVGSIQTSGKVQLMISAIAADEEPDAVLYDGTLANYGALSVAFKKKPSGATSVKAYAFTDNPSERIEIGELLEQRDLNHNQWAEIYGYMLLLEPEQSPYSEFLNTEIERLTIALEIEGGTFDGEKLTLEWPGTYDPPPEVYEEGSEGNKGDIGMDGGVSPDNGGQRPNLPNDYDDDESDASPSDGEQVNKVVTIASNSSEPTLPPPSAPQPPAELVTPPPESATMEPAPEPTEPPVSAPLQSTPTAAQPMPTPERKGGRIPVALPIVAVTLLIVGLAITMGAPGTAWTSAIKKAIGTIMQFK